MIDPKFHLQAQADKNDRYPVLMLFSVNGKRMQYYSGIKVPSSSKPIKGKDKPGKWPFKEFSGSPAVKAKLELLKSHAYTIETELIKNGLPQTVELFKQGIDRLYKGRSNAELMTITKIPSIEDRIVEYLEYVTKKKAHNTYRNSQTSLNHFREFLSKSKDNLTVSHIDRNMIQAFREHLLEGRLNNTVVKAIQVLRTFLQYCFKEGYILNLPIIETGTPNEITVIHLSYDEVMKIAYTPMPSVALERVRNFFVFGCFTGMRYGDIARLKKSNVYDTHIKFFTEKNGTTQALTIPLTPVSKSIINSYKGFPGEYAIPSISNQKTNNHLKDVAKYAGIDSKVEIAYKDGFGKVNKLEYQKWELVTCHVSRKSFITIAMTLGMPESTIISITGHTKGSKAFHKYYDVVNQTKFEQMNKLFNI